MKIVYVALKVYLFRSKERKKSDIMTTLHLVVRHFDKRVKTKNEVKIIGQSNESQTNAMNPNISNMMNESHF